MNDFMCRKFLLVRNWFPDRLINGKYHFNGDNIFKEYCTSNSCDGDLEKINAGCLFLFDSFFKDASVFKNHNNINIADYIIIWLSYMLNLKKNVEGITNIQHFYGTSINSDNRYKNTITGIPGHDNYKDLIDKKKELMDIPNEKMSKLYNLFKILCDIYTNFDDNNPDCAKYIQNANQFVKTYQELNGDSNNTDSSLYRKILYNLSIDYGNFKTKCKEIPSLLDTKTEQTSAQISEDTSSSSSITSKLFIVLSIFGAIAFFLGISYKYSLFGFRKRFQKQKLREKLKNVKKRMNQ
ncbi:PIR protein [Plasmodium yoelii]|uniref:PIR protein n=2 Tax=Plasmodium yoelii TaxID=5861 RepID=A0AAE9WIU0_PLAYO|nr:PIR protein [Plasmodium yoelii]WBY54648.1 PIR protein [Plasmodium yoelii yoelii]CDU16017.1 YIR protein [Plasmodium yoelii]VTZ71641.1 PIR protein [Plasmodium yoelii]|eukprot:XP_022810966.1 PIR protein [Plasmodium yoelii]